MSYHIFVLFHSANVDAFRVSRREQVRPSRHFVASLVLVMSKQERRKDCRMRGGGGALTIEDTAFPTPQCGRKKCSLPKLFRWTHIIKSKTLSGQASN